MKNICLIFIGFSFAWTLYPSSAYSLTIKQPISNSKFRPGEVVRVVLEPATNDDIVAIWIYSTPESSSGKGVLLGPPYEIDMQLDNQYVGNARIEAVARLKDNTAIKAGVDIIVQLPPEVMLEKIVVDKSDSIMKSAVGKPLNTRKLWVQGLFTDNVQREISATYTSSDPNIVSVDSNGVITALNLGRAIVSINAGDKSESVDIKVYINIEIDSELLVKLADTGIQLDWKLSPQDPEWVTGYMVFRTEDPDGVIKRKIADVPNGTTTYIDTTAVKGKTYYYGVQAISATANERSSMTNMTPGVLP